MTKEEKAELHRINKEKRAARNKKVTRKQRMAAREKALAANPPHELTPEEYKNLERRKGEHQVAIKTTVELVTPIEDWTSDKPALWHCLKCGKTFERSPKEVRKTNLKCPWCDNKFQPPYTEPQLRSLVFDTWGNEYSILNMEKFTKKDGSKRILVRHDDPDCGFCFSVNAYKFIGGQGCPKCGPIYNEYEIERYFKKNEFMYQPQQCREYKGQALYFDFYLEEGGKKFFVDFYGRQHYEPLETFGGEKYFNQVRMLDVLKQKYCNVYNIEYIIVPYNDRTFLKDNLLAQRLGREIEISTSSQDPSLQEEDIVSPNTEVLE